MTLHCASTFTKALGRLNASEQKLVKVTAFDLQLDPTGNGLQMHRVDKAPGFWTARVSQDIRLVLHKAGDNTTLAYVDHHDAAYRWAERRRLIPHERTGSMQFVVIPEREEAQGVCAFMVDASGGPERGMTLEVASGAITVTARAADHPAISATPFAGLSDDALLDVGVPRDWLDAVRRAAETSVTELFDLLPEEAAEALLDYLTGGRLEDHIAPRVSPDADPFAHPDAQRRFRAIEGVEELRAALDAPFAQWAVFLHPAQRAPVTRDWRGPARVSGSAGTGKTIVALHRAVHLAGRTGARVLLTTFSKPLAAALAGKAALMTEAAPELRASLTVRSLDQAAYDLYAHAFGQPSLASASQVRAMIDAAVKTGHGAGHDAAFLFEEWDELVDAWGIADAADYAAVPRLGRKTRLGPKQRDSAWGVFAFVRERLAARGLVSWADLYARLGERIAAGSAFGYSHVVVDEAQDLSVAQARFLAAIGQMGAADALFFTGDLGQRIFHLPFSWAKLGIDVRGRSTVLKVCYRTSHQIRQTADRLLACEITDQDGVAEARTGTVSVFDGPEPVVVLVDNEAAECAAVGTWLRAALADGFAADELAVLVRGQGQLSRGQVAAKAAGADVSVLTMHEAKGLEFRGVAVMALDEDVLPDAGRLAGVGDIADLEAVQDTERHLLYVAATRARDRLMLAGIAPGSEFLDDLK
jgi:UvrD-like helicase C-terminal domain/AAA domain